MSTLIHTGDITYRDVGTSGTRDGTSGSAAPEVTVVPNHVPQHVAAEHPDAAAVVAASRRRPTTVRPVAGARRYRPSSSKARPVLALVACALVAGAAIGGAPQGRAGGATAPPEPTAQVVRAAGDHRTDSRWLREAGEEPIFAHPVVTVDL